MGGLVVRVPRMGEEAEKEQEGGTRFKRVKKNE